LEKALPLVADVLRRAQKAHVKVVLGTDAVAGAHGPNAEVFIYRVQNGGDTPMDALLSGTSVAAESLGMVDRIGSLAEGKQANIVAVDGNPLDDITAVRRVVFVMKHGRNKDAPIRPFMGLVAQNGSSAGSTSPRLNSVIDSVTYLASPLSAQALTRLPRRSTRTQYLEGGTRGVWFHRKSFPALCQSLAMCLSVTDAILDGEIVYRCPDG
jgi:hypothetical protein